MIERLSEETRANFKTWITADFKNEILFDTIASDIIDLFPTKRLFLEHKPEILKFIESSLPFEYQLILQTKFGRNLPPEMQTKKKEQTNLKNKIYRLFLKLTAKLYGSDFLQPSNQSIPSESDEEISEDESKKSAVKEASMKQCEKKKISLGKSIIQCNQSSWVD